jgi:hypothetical protein
MDFGYALLWSASSTAEIEVEPNTRQRFGQRGSLSFPFEPTRQNDLIYPYGIWAQLKWSVCLNTSNP